MAQEQIHNDIKWLEQQLEAKKKELAEKPREQKEEKEIVKEIIREAPTAPAPPPSLRGVSSDDNANKTAQDLKEKEHEEIINELVKLAFSKDLLSALKAAESLKNPHLLDEFHDILADQYYQKLLDARKLK